MPKEKLGPSIFRRVKGYFLDENPNFWVAMVPALALAAILFTRSLTTNFIFDEQEALLANPYVNGKNLLFRDAVRRDFWGLPPERSVGSYRPLPNVIWRLVASGMRALHDLGTRVTHTPSTYQLYPWIFHWCNVILHAVNGALLVCLVFHVTKRRGLAWLAGAIFVASAVLTEAVAGVVGIADVLGGLGALLGLAALRWPLWGMPFGVFGAMLVGLFSKESALVCVPLGPLAALWLAPYTHPKRPLAVLRFFFAAAAAVLAFVLYVEGRKRWFPSAAAAELLEPLPAMAGRATRAMRAFLLWFHQPSLPKDPLNNPLVQADMPHRIAGALRVYWRGLVQLVFPMRLSGDYSFPQEPVPERVFFFESVLGGLSMALPLVAAVVLWVRSLSLRYRAAPPRLVVDRPVSQRPPGDDDETTSNLAGARHALMALALVWIVVSYFPHSNIPVLLPTVRAERFLYFPALGSSVLLACYFAAFHRNSAGSATRKIGAVLFAAFFGFQCVKARLHALDYTDDLAFWSATKNAVPRSAKAHLNYSVMWGARGHLDVRLVESKIAVELAPQWPMAHIYLGDTLCRLHRADEAWPYYVAGFKLADNDPNLISLALQCLWDEGRFKEHEEELLQLADEHADSWLDFLAKDTSNNGAEHGGVNPKYRPRGYNEGPKE
ncbi:MAG TPA: tetratricopeptide repeat protein [Polyangiaceae bacterium]|nr:tetratricopeptide repeat protein [Polyangiaceae bacterium]